MHQLPRDIWNNHLIPYFSDADFVHLVTTCRTYYNEFSGYKRMGACYNVSQIYRVVDRYDFSNVIYDLKIFRPEYLPQNLNTIQLWKLPKTIGQGIPEIISQGYGQTAEYICCNNPGHPNTLFTEIGQSDAKSQNIRFHL